MRYESDGESIAHKASTFFFQCCDFITEKVTKYGTMAINGASNLWNGFLNWSRGGSPSSSSYERYAEQRPPAGGSRYRARREANAEMLEQGGWDVRRGEIGYDGEVSPYGQRHSGQVPRGRPVERHEIF